MKGPLHVPAVNSKVRLSFFSPHASKGQRDSDHPPHIKQFPAVSSSSPWHLISESFFMPGNIWWPVEAILHTAIYSYQLNVNSKIDSICPQHVRLTDATALHCTHYMHRILE